MLIIANWWRLLKLVCGTGGRTSVNIWTTNLDAKRRNIWNRQHNGAYVMFSHQLNDNLRGDSNSKSWEKAFNLAVIQCIGIVDNWELSSFSSNRNHHKLFCLPACLLNYVGNKISTLPPNSDFSLPCYCISIYTICCGTLSFSDAGNSQRRKC